MKEICVIVDVSGSMCTMGKPSVLGNLMQTLSTLQNFYDEFQRISFSKMQWDGGKESLESLVEKLDGKNVLLLTDGYALSDSCRTSRCIKKFIAANVNNFFVVLCGGDALDVSVLKRNFGNLRAVNARDILFAVENFPDDSSSQSDSHSNDADSDKDGWG